MVNIKYLSVVSGIFLALTFQPGIGIATASSKAAVSSDYKSLSQRDKQASDEVQKLTHAFAQTKAASQTPTRGCPGPCCVSQLTATWQEQVAMSVYCPNHQHQHKPYLFLAQVMLTKHFVCYSISFLDRDTKVSAASPFHPIKFCLYW